MENDKKTLKQFIAEQTIGHIKKGAFHAWLGKEADEPITNEDIQRGLAAGGHAAKMANFARNARKFHHTEDVHLDGAVTEAKLPFGMSSFAAGVRALASGKLKPTHKLVKKTKKVFPDLKSVKTLKPFDEPKRKWVDPWAPPKESSKPLSPIPKTKKKPKLKLVKPFDEPKRKWVDPWKKPK